MELKATAKTNTLSNICKIKKNNITKSAHTSTKDSVSFGNTYYSKVNKVFTKDFKTLTHVQNAFKELFEALENDQTITKNSIFEKLNHKLKKDGFKGLMNELQSPEDKNILLESVYKDLYSDPNVPAEPLVLAQKNGKPVLQLDDYNAIFGIKSDVHCPVLTFHSDLEFPLVAFSIDKKNQTYKLEKCGKTSQTITEYYPDTGNKKVEVENYAHSQSRTFYNPDGSKPFWKNFILGGTVTF